MKLSDIFFVAAIISQPGISGGSRYIYGRDDYSEHPDQGRYPTFGGDDKAASSAVRSALTTPSTRANN